LAIVIPSPLSGASQYRPGRARIVHISDREIRAHNGRVGHLCGVAGDDVFERILERAAFGQQQQAHARAAAGLRQLLQFGSRQGLAVVLAARALPLGDGLVQRRYHGLGRFEADGDAAVARRVEARLGVQAVGQRRLRQILGGAAERDEEVVVVGVDHGAAPRQVGLDRDTSFLDAKPPALRVVARRRERGIAHQFVEQRKAIARRHTAMAPGRLHGLFVTCAWRAGGKRWRERCTEKRLPAGQHEHSLAGRDLR